MGRWGGGGGLHSLPSRDRKKGLRCYEGSQSLQAGQQQVGQLVALGAVTCTANSHHTLRKPKKESMVTLTESLSQETRAGNQ